MIELFSERTAKALKLDKGRVKAVMQLLEDGATIPFIARYRKELSGAMDEVQISDVAEKFSKLKDLLARKATIEKAIAEQGNLTPPLSKQIQNCWDATMLEDLYLPYKKKRQTRGEVAKKKGLEPLARFLFMQENTAVQSVAKKYLNQDVANIDDALAGARDIIAEWINENAEVRDQLRRLFRREAMITAKVVKSKKAEAKTYTDYFDFAQALRQCPSHRLLAIRRGENQGLLRVSIDIEVDHAHEAIEKKVIKNKSESAKQVREASKDAYKRLLKPSIETEFKNISKEAADQVAMEVFASNLRQLLLAAPLGSKVILGLDPGFKSGCKLVVVDRTGKLLYNSNIYPHPPQNKTSEAKHLLAQLIEKYKVEAIAIGNGTAGKETLQLCKSIDLSYPMEIYLVNESGASIYSASKIARDEFPDKDITVRGAVSIARRLMDPLAELVKIDPKSIGVGQYQHDVNQTKLKEKLDNVVSLCVNAVGINLNTASENLLSYVSGLNAGLAKNIVAYRDENGMFKKRSELNKVKRLGNKSFEQAAGFLRIKRSTHPLDNTGIHPERYILVKEMAASVGCKVKDLIGNKAKVDELKLSTFVNKDIGIPTLKDIQTELKQPGLDPRGEAKQISFADHINSIEDLEVGMVLPGIINNITKFGAFVDIGIKQGGMVHISQLANKFVKDPADVVHIEQHVQVKIMEIDMDRGRIQLSMKDVNE